MHTLRILPLVGLLALVVSGCGGDSAGTGTTDDASSGVDAHRPDTSIPADETTPPPTDVKTTDEYTPPDISDDCTNDGDPCDDGDPCTDDDRCEDGVCVGTAMDCDDANECTADSCDPEAGGCIHAALDVGTCDDGDLCTTNDRCEDGVCVSEGATCDDENPCTADSCDPTTGECAHEALVGEPCEDGNNCTFNGTCSADGECVGEHIECDDGIPCTNDVCTAAGDCIHVPEKSNCDDGNPCTADYCDPNADCVHAGVLADEPVQDGSIAEWSVEGVVATNSLPSEIDGADLRSISVSVSRTSLHLAIEGTVPDDHVMLVFLDRNFALRPEGDGVRDLTTITGGGPLAAAAAVDMQVTAFGFGADFVIGTSDPFGCLTLAEDGAATAADCVIQTNDDEKSAEVTIPWESLFGRAPTEDDAWTVAGFAVLADRDTHAPTNQALPGQLMPALRRVFYFPVAGGPCLAPFCGDGIPDPGEVCDDMNDDPNDGCDQCGQPAPPGMVAVPAGEFIMGKDTIRMDDSWRPSHAVWLDTYFIDKYEVTTTEFAEFLTANDFEMRANSVYDADGNLLYLCANTHSLVPCAVAGVYTPEPGFEDHPIGETTWWAAYHYCAWRGKRLATEAEWEKAARGTDEREYPWGDEADPDAVNCDELSCHDGFAYTAPIGTFPDGVSPYGVFDMAGNVWEWVNDWFDAGYYSVSPYENPLGPCDGAFECPTADARVARGGSWDDLFPFLDIDPNYLASYHRYETQAGCISDIGIRCAMSPSE